MKVTSRLRAPLLVLVILSLPFTGRYAAKLAWSQVCDQKRPEDPGPLCGSAEPKCEELSHALCPNAPDNCATTGMYREKVPKDCVASGIDCDDIELLCVWAEDETPCWLRVQCVWKPNIGANGTCVPYIKDDEEEPVEEE